MLETFSPLTLLLVPVMLIILAIPLRFWKMKHVIMAFLFCALFVASLLSDIAVADIIIRLEEVTDEH